MNSYRSDGVMLMLLGALVLLLSPLVLGVAGMSAGAPNTTRAAAAALFLIVLGIFSFGISLIVKGLRTFWLQPGEVLTTSKFQKVYFAVIIVSVLVLRFWDKYV